MRRIVFALELYNTSANRTNRFDLNNFHTNFLQISSSIPSNHLIQTTPQSTLSLQIHQFTLLQIISWIQTLRKH